MSFKSILAAIAPTGAKQAGGDFAVSMGYTLGARVTGCSYALHPDFPGSGLPWVPDDLVQNHLTSIIKEAHSAVQIFQNAAKRLKVESAGEVFRASLHKAITAFGEYARVYDVAVVTQSERGAEHLGDLFAEAALFYSGRPLVLVPKDYSAPFSADRILIAWDGSQHAAAAVAHAMPILAMAAKVEILIVGNNERVDQVRARKLVANLELHGMNVELICRDESDDAGAIAREATAWGASLLVMGGYGHSRAREIIFGGVTRYMMSQTPLAVFMAH